MSKKFIRIVSFTILIGIILYFIFNISTVLIDSISKVKKKEFISLPTEYLNLFDKKIRDSVYHNNTIFPLDSSNYPISNVKYNSKNIIILKFYSKSSLKKIFEIKYKKTKLTRLIPYTSINANNVEFNYSTDIKKEIDYIHLYTQKPFDTIEMSDSLLLGKGHLKSLSFKFSDEEKSNVINVKKKWNTNQGYNLVLLKKKEFIYLMYFNMPSKDIMNKEDIYNILNTDNL